MFDIAFTYAKFTSELGAGAAPADAAARASGTTTSRARRASPPSGGGADPGAATPLTFLDILLAILAFALYLVELLAWIATVLPTILLELATWPLRELIYTLLLLPAWDLYMLCRKPLVLEGFLAPRPSEISTGLVQLGADEQANGVDQLRADLNAPIGVAAAMKSRSPGPGPDADGADGRVRPRPGLSPGTGHGPGSAVERQGGDRRPPCTASSSRLGATRTHNMAGMRDRLGGAADARGAVRPERRRSRS